MDAEEGGTGKKDEGQSGTTKMLLVGGLVAAVAGSVFSARKYQQAVQLSALRHGQRELEGEMLRRQKTMFVQNARQAKQKAAKYAEAARDITMDMKRHRPQDLMSVIHKIDKDKESGPLQLMLNRLEASRAGIVSNDMLASGEWEFSDDERKASFKNKVITKGVVEALGRLGFEFGQVVNEDEARAAYILQSIASEPDMSKFGGGIGAGGSGEDVSEDNHDEEKESERNKVLEDAHKRLEEVGDAYQFLQEHYYGSGDGGNNGKT